VEREPVRELQAWVLDHLAADLSVEALARRVHMSPRNFFRIFVREVGMTPARFVERARIEGARRLLEETSRGVVEVATACGFGSPETMRVAFRGGGANMGVVTSFEYRLHPVGPVLGGDLAWPFEKARHVLRFYADFAGGCPDELSVNAGLANAPDGTPVVGVGVAWCGAIDAGERLLKPLRSFESPMIDTIGAIRYVELQRSGDDAFPLGRRHYWKGAFLRRLELAAIDVLVEFGARRPSPYTRIGLQRMHGAAAWVPATDTAFAHRHDQWDCLMLSQWESAADDERNIGWTRNLHASMQPYLEQAVYVNDLGEEEADRIRLAYGENYDRLVAVKAKYDPDNFFRANQNVRART
jgi:hypothetical protein